MNEKDQIKRDLLQILGPDETSSDLITQLATYVVEKIEVTKLESKEYHNLKVVAIVELFTRYLTTEELKEVDDAMYKVEQGELSNAKSK